jgi:hypothetical protein
MSHVLPTDTSEQGLETLIMRHMCGVDGLEPATEWVVAEKAVEQYRRDRDPRELLFQFGRCIVHLAVDDAEVQMCTKLEGKASWFLPLNKG